MIAVSKAAIGIGGAALAALAFSSPALVQAAADPEAQYVISADPEWNAPSVAAPQDPYWN
ncbi:hypothetical protein [Streptomyces sp. NPDC056144]|uniref:hypothetical protein n=1 Tax=unclassified Streptomyces TaxID=2593676 RepID=UPI0035DDC838